MNFGNEPYWPVKRNLPPVRSRPLDGGVSCIRAPLSSYSKWDTSIMTNPMVDYETGVVTRSCNRIASFSLKRGKRPVGVHP